MYKTPPSLSSLFFSHVGCSWGFKQTIILCNCCHIFGKKTPHTACTCEDSAVICWNTCHHSYIWTILAPQYRHCNGADGACFVLKSFFFVLSYLPGVFLKTAKKSQPNKPGNSREIYYQKIMGRFWKNTFKGTNQHHISPLIPPLMGLASFESR